MTATVTDRPLLLDLQAVIAWTVQAVPPKVHQLISSGALVYVSAISPWEFLLKRNRQSFGIDYLQLLTTIQSLQAGFLPIKRKHLDRLESQPFVKDRKGKDHKDPFDRLLVAQALEEDFVLVGDDHMFQIYKKELSLKVLWGT